MPNKFLFCVLGSLKDQSNWPAGECLPHLCLLEGLLVITPFIHC